MLIILEGPDCAGKSTLVERFHDELARRKPDDKVIVLRSGPPAGHPLDEYVTPLLNYRPDTGIHVICDRLHWGERVYPHIFDRQSKMTPAVWRFIESWLSARGAVVAHVTAPVAELRRRMQARGDDLVDVDQLDEIHDRFFQVADDSMLPRGMYRSDNPTVVDEVITRAAAYEESTRQLNEFVTYVGPVRPRRLLLGDVRGPSFQTDDPLNALRPSFMPYPSMSGAFLWTALASANYEYFTQLGVGVANACDTDDVNKLWRVLGRPSTVTLGANAYSCFEGVAYRAPHPQYVRRFHSKRGLDYRDQVLFGKQVTWN